MKKLVRGQVPDRWDPECPYCGRHNNDFTVDGRGSGEDVVFCHTCKGTFLTKWRTLPEHSIHKIEGLGPKE